MAADIILFIVFMIIIFMIIYLKRRAPPEKIPDDIHPVVAWIYPAGAFLYKYTEKFIGRMDLKALINVLKKLNAGDGAEELKSKFFSLIYASLLGIILAFTVLYVGADLSDKVSQRAGLIKSLEKQEPGGGKRQVKLNRNAEGGSEDIVVTVPERTYSDREKKEFLDQAEAYITRRFKGSNKSLDHVTMPLYMPGRIKGSPVRINWEYPEDYISADGTLHNIFEEDHVECEVRAVLKIKDMEKMLSFPLTIDRKKLTGKQLFLYEWDKALKKEKEEHSSSKTLSLPSSAAGVTVSYSEPEKETGNDVIHFFMLAALLVPALITAEVFKAAGARDEEMKLSFSDMADRFVLLLNAGLSVKSVWFRLADEYQQKRAKGLIRKKYLYEEMMTTRDHLKNGMSESEAFEDFGRRCSLVNYMKFSSLLVQNQKKGNESLLAALEGLAEDSLKNRRDLAKEAGEKAGTRMLIPMILMLVVVIVIIMTAAFSSF
ncbi:MAG: type II secretion system F family protein [Lachnospiraceae bacterium]|jgi:tight adherence protein C|nr:type II secretion system F family protein [Lachnospiraceae bacterium]MEE3460430.1 type II secretion system F family protein [Lachnospiraceae bacterium]